MKTPFFSFIIPVYNVEDYIERCLVSILNQDIDKSEYEIVIINDGTLDNSMDIVNKYAKNDYKFQIIDQPNQGVSSARNRGMEIAKGEYLLFVDPDDEIVLGSIQRLYDELVKRRVEVLILKSIVYKNNGVKKNLFPFGENLSNKVFKGTDLFKYYNRGSVWGVAFQKKFIDKFRFRFNENMSIGEDSLFFCDILAYANKIILNPIEYYIIWKREGSATDQFDEQKIIRVLLSSKEIYSKIKENESIIPIRAIYSNQLYRLVSICCYYWSKLKFSCKNFNKIRKTIKELNYRPLPINGVYRLRFKMHIFNFSLSLFIILFYIRKIIIK